MIGTPAYGYKNVDGKMVVDEEKAAIVRRMFASVMEGKSGAKIASELQAEGIPTARGGKWQSSVIIGMIRKLIYGRDAVLLPMSGRLLGGGNTEVLGRLESLNTELAMVAERRQAADKFFAKGLLDAAVYREELDALAQKEKEINAARNGIEGDPDLDFDRQLALNELLKYTAKAEQLTAFSDEVFTKHVDRVIIFSRKEVGFVMKCGPVFRERI